MEEAIHYLEANFRRRPHLDEIAGSVCPGKYHFQRLFERWAGISRTRFLRFLTVECAKERLRESQSVPGAALDAGLSGPGRLHDLFVVSEALTPAEYRRPGAGLRIALGFHETPFGQYLLATTARGICALYFVSGDDGSAALDQLTNHWSQARFVEDHVQTRPLVDRIFSPVVADRRRPWHLLLKGADFQVEVWQALLMWRCSGCRSVTVSTIRRSGRSSRSPSAPRW